MSLEQSAVLEIVLDDDVRDCVKDKTYIVGVSSAGKVSVDLFLVLALVQVFKLKLNVGRRILVRVGT